MSNNLFYVSVSFHEEEHVWYKIFQVLEMEIRTLHMTFFDIHTPFSPHLNIWVTRLVDRVSSFN